MLLWKVISIGPKYGLLCINGKVIDGDEAVKNKKELLEREHQIFKGSHVALKYSKSQIAKIHRFI